MQQAHGFTLIELLVVLAIVSIITAIAIPQFSDYKAKAFDMRAMSDLRSVAIAEEAYFIEAETYISCTESNCNLLPGINKLSKGVVLTIAATSTGFTGSASHPKGSGKIYQWNSIAGGLQ